MKKKITTAIITSAFIMSMLPKVTTGFIYSSRKMVTTNSMTPDLPRKTRISGVKMKATSRIIISSK